MGNKCVGWKIKLSLNTKRKAMNKIIKVSVNLFFCTFLIYLMSGCDFNKETRYIQLTSDDLAHLYINLDTLYYDGNEIEYTDSVRFLLNSRDTITACVETQIWSELSQFAIVDIRYMYGESIIYFDKSSGFDYAEVRIFRENDTLHPSNKTLAAKSNISLFFYYLYEVIYGPYPLDTAVVLDRQYEDVYKFLPPSENHESGIKTVYFAKKYGFIMIESYDGSKVELIEIKSKGVKE